MRASVRRWWRSERTRRRLAQVLAVIGAAFAAIGVFSGRYGWLVAGVVIVLVGVSLSPWGLRRR